MKRVKTDEDKPDAKDETTTTASTKVDQDDSPDAKNDSAPKPMKKPKQTAQLLSAKEGGVPLPRFKLDNVEIPQDPDERI